MRTQLPALAAVLIVVAAGVTHGQWTGRWGYSTDLQDSPARLARIPLNVGDWKGEDIAIDEKKKNEFDHAELVGRLLRSYVNKKTGDAVSLFLVSGLPGPISTHVPETCFSGSGYELRAKPRKMKVEDEGGGKESTFFSGEFRKPESPVAPGLRVLWAWLDKDRWEAVDDPRTAFASSRCLYKFYIVREVPNGAEEIAGEEPAVRFLKALTPALDEELVSLARR